ncbi:PepSY-associated TM helix domain-containing protein [Roseateles sp. BYS180W]|uniref:PepSY-associated TM helix domain-containing protein n=1 Tax=Roseateles rivi TaxID=3299028 RepID=A0ABW7FT44_9BURK
MSERRAQPASTWLKTLHLWHWVSAALSLVGMLLFSLTGITLNHASAIESKARLTQVQLQLPEPLLQSLRQNAEAAAAAAQTPQPLPPALRQWLSTQLPRPVPPHAAEWSADEVYVAMPRPGGDAWLRIALERGELEFEDSDRGWIAYFNDLHKGRHAGAVWQAVIDVLALACVLFTVTGLLILKAHAVVRPSTWPLVGAGLVLPALVALLLIH